jgi:pyruvate kinase
MIRAGMDVARVNFSHGTRVEHRSLLKAIRRAADDVGRVVGTLADIPGPKLRINDLNGQELHADAGSSLYLVEADSLATTTIPMDTDGAIAISRLGVLAQLDVGAAVSFADGAVQAVVDERVGEDAVRCSVHVGGTLVRRKGVNFPNAQVYLPALTKDDEDHIAFATEEGVDYIAISFVGTPDDIKRAKEIATEHQRALRPKVVAKIERPNALADIEAIVRASDAVMVARGDLGVEIPPEEVPIEQKRIIHLCNAIGRPVITATQMLESMIHAPMPTRAEATDVANAILDGTDAIMLSAETATGQYPLEAVRYMDRIARRTESELRNPSLTHLSRPTPQARTVADAVAHAAMQSAGSLSAKVIIAVTESGHSARVASKFRPSVPILGAARSRAAAGSLTLSFGVTPVVLAEGGEPDVAMNEAIAIARSMELADLGDLVILVAGVPFGVSGTTNFMKIQRVGDAILWT